MCERRKHPLFPGVQQIIWQSSLRGMEQPVRSFKSFIRSAPPHRGPNSEKPLPLVPALQEKPKKKTSLPSSPRPPIRSFSVSSWKAPAAWDDPGTPDPETETSTFSTYRRYAPLLPESSPSLYDSEEQSPWPIKSSSARQSFLAPITEQDDYLPLPSPFSAIYASPLSIPISKSEQDLRKAIPDMSTSATQAITTVPSSLAHPNITSVTPDLTKKQGFASPDIQSDKDAHTISEHRPAQPEDSGDLGITLLLRSKNLQQQNQDSSKFQEISSDINMDERLQKLDVSQEYHNVLADQYHEDHTDYPMADGLRSKEPSNSAVASFKSPPKDQELIPRPLSWRKDSSGSSLRGSNPHITGNATSLPNSRKRYRKVPAWMRFHQPSQAHSRLDLNDDQPKHARQLAAPTRKETQLSNLIPHVKGLRPNLHRTRRTYESAGRHSQAIPHRSTSPFIYPPLEQPTPLLRLPGGLALVRQSRTPTQNSRYASSFNVSPSLNQPHATTNTCSHGSDIYPTVKRPSSKNSQYSDAPVAPAASGIKRLRTSLNSLPSRQSHSNTSSSPTSPLAHEISFPRTPPPVPHHPSSLAVRSKLSHESEATCVDELADSATDDEPRKHGVHVGILDRARDARQAWKRHHNHAKHEKLKKSIRVLGPTDPGVAAAYVRREGMVSDDDRVHGSRMPGYLGAGPL
jgi:hypothetical protein